MHIVSHLFTDVMVITILNVPPMIVWWGPPSSYIFPFMTPRCSVMHGLYCLSSVLDDAPTLSLVLAAILHVHSQVVGIGGCFIIPPCPFSLISRTHCLPIYFFRHFFCICSWYAAVNNETHWASDATFMCSLSRILPINTFDYMASLPWCIPYYVNLVLGNWSMASYYVPLCPFQCMRIYMYLFNILSMYCEVIMQLIKYIFFFTDIPCHMLHLKSQSSLFSAIRDGGTLTHTI